MLFDGHVHFFTRSFYQAHADLANVTIEKVQSITGQDIPGPDSNALADRWASEMDRHGVNRMVLMASIPGDGVLVAKAISRHPDRFSGYFMVNPSMPDYLSRLRRGIEELKLRGVCLFPALHHFYPDEERLHPVYEALDRYGAVAFVHFGLLKIPLRDRLGLPPIADLNYSNPIRLHKVCNAFPNVSFIIPHFGCGFFHELLLLGSQTKNVFVDTASSNNWIDLYPDLNLKKVFQKTLHVFGPERIIFGTDSSVFPRGWRKDIYEAQRDVVASLNLRSEDEAKIFGGNLAKLLEHDAGTSSKVAP